MNDVAIEVVDAVHIDTEAARALAELLWETWPKDTSSVQKRFDELCRDWRDYQGEAPQRPRYFCVRQSQRALAMALAAPRTIGTVEGCLTILALARVCVTRRLRGSGLGQAVVRAAFDMVDREVYPFALFQTSDEVQPFYERLGARVVTNRIVNSRDPRGARCPFWDNVVMRYSDRPGWPEGQIDLLGPGY